MTVIKAQVTLKENVIVGVVTKVWQQSDWTMIRIAYQAQEWESAHEQDGNGMGGWYSVSKTIDVPVYMCDWVRRMDCNQGGEHAWVMDGGQPSYAVRGGEVIEYGHEERCYCSKCGMEIEEAASKAWLAERSRYLEIEMAGVVL